MRVKISTNPPLPPVRAWIPLAPRHGDTVSSFKSLLCTCLPAFHDISPALLHLSIDGFELLDHSELSVVRDGDLISVDSREAGDATAPTQTVGQRISCLTSLPPRAGPPSKPGAAASTAGSRKRKRPPSTSTSGSESDSESSSESESESESNSESETSDSGSGSDVSSVSSRGKRVASQKERAKVTPKPQLQTFVPPGYGKPQTRSRNRRRRLRLQHEREAAAAGVASGPVSGANAVAPSENMQDANGDVYAVPALMSLSLRNKNKAKNFRSLMNRPLPPKIIFGDDEEGVSTSSGATTQRHDPPRLIPPSDRASLPPNVFVTSVDVEAGVRSGKKRKTRDEREDEVDVTLDYGGEEEDVERIEAMANERWDTLAGLTRSVAPGALVGHKALGIDPVTFTPGHVLTVGRVESCDVAVLVVRPLRAVSFNWLENAEADAEEHPWEEIEHGDWRML